MNKDRSPAPLHVRFWRHVEKTDSCWLWTSSRLVARTGGYGVITVGGRKNGKRLHAHRVSWEIHFGSIPDGLSVLHNCPGGDNPLCVNPAHLWLGRQADNIHDMDRKGRRRSARRPGESNPMCRITDEQAAEIIRRARAGESIAQIWRSLNYPVSYSHVAHMASGQRRSHLHA